MAWPEVGKEIKTVLGVIEERLGKFVANAVLVGVLTGMFLLFASLVYGYLPAAPTVGPESLREGTKLALTIGMVWGICSLPFWGAVYWLRRTLDARRNDINVMQRELSKVVDKSATTMHNAHNHIERDFRQIESVQQEIVTSVSDMKKLSSTIGAIVDQIKETSDEKNARHS